MAQSPHLVRRSHSRLGRTPAGLGQHIADHFPDHPPHRLQAGEPGVEAGKVLGDAAQDRTNQRYFHELFEIEESCFDAVVDIVVVIGDVVGESGDLRLRGRPGRKAQIVRPIIGGDLAPGRTLQHAAHRAVVLDHTLQGFPSEVESVEGRVAALEPGDDTEGLDVVVEAAERGHSAFKFLLSGVAEGRMAQIVAQSHRFGEIRVQAERGGDRAGDLRHLQGVGQARAEMIAFMGDENLRFLLQPAERRGVDNPIAVTGERRARRARRFVEPATPRGGGILGPGKSGAGPSTLRHGRTALAQKYAPLRRGQRGII